MEYRLGNSKRIYSQGTTDEITCPRCSAQAEFSVYTNFEARLTAKLPLVEAANVYFAVCSCCGAVFGVDSKVGSAFRKGKGTITSESFIELKKFEV